MSEEREVPGYPGILATADGRIISLRTPGFRRELGQRKNQGGYLCVNIKAAPGRANKRKIVVHRLVLLAWHGHPPAQSSRAVCRHLDGVKGNNRKDNLRWGTDKENHADAVLHGTQGHGMKASRRKLTSEQVSELRSMIASRVPYRQIAERFNIHKDYVYQIKVGRSW